MAINANHIFEELGDVKCSIVEKNCKPERVAFLKSLLEHNGFKVVAIKSPAPKVAATKPVAVSATPEGVESEAVTTPPQTETGPTGPETFTVGVSDLTFNPINAVLNRELKSPDGNIVTQKYWQQKENQSNPEVWYWKK